MKWVKIEHSQQPGGITNGKRVESGKGYQSSFSFLIIPIQEPYFNIRSQRNMSEQYSLEEVQELQSRPIFLSQFLRLTLPSIRTLQPSASSSSTESTEDNVKEAWVNNDAYFPSSSNPPTSSSPPSLDLFSLPLEPWSSFLPNLHRSLTQLQGTEHILPPPAFRRDDLPVATMLPTVFLWCIVQIWQPTLRMFELDEFGLNVQQSSRSVEGEEVGSGGNKTLNGTSASSSTTDKPRTLLKVGDHLPDHTSLDWAQQGHLPRQVFYNILASSQKGSLVSPEEENKGIAALISVVEPWKVDLTTLSDPSKGSKSAQSALATILTSLQAAKLRYGLLTNYETTLFIQVSYSSDEISKVELSPLIGCKDELDQNKGKSTSIFAAMWYFGGLVAAAS